MPRRLIQIRSYQIERENWSSWLRRCEKRNEVSEARLVQRSLSNIFAKRIRRNCKQNLCPCPQARGTGTSAKHCLWMFSVCEGRSQFYLSYAQDVLVNYIVNAFQLTYNPISWVDWQVFAYFCLSSNSFIGLESAVLASRYPRHLLSKLLFSEKFRTL